MQSSCSVDATRRLKRKDAEQTIADIEWLERIFAVPDTRPLSSSDLAAANRRHDEALAQSPWFRCGGGMASAAERSLQFSDWAKLNADVPRTFIQRQEEN